MRFSRLAGFAFAGAIFAAFIVCSAALASFAPRVSAQHNSDGSASVVVNNRTAIRFHLPNGGLLPSQRAELTAQRLLALVSNSNSPSSISTKRMGAKAWVVWGNANLCVVTRKDAKAAGGTVEGVAAAWAGRLRSFLSMPAITVSSREIVVPVSEARSIQVGGAATGPVSVGVSSPEVVAGEVAGEKRCVIIRGKTVGDTRVSIVCEGETEWVSVHVRKYAGSVKQGAATMVTGDPAPGWLLSARAVAALEKSLQIESGASAQFGEPRLPQSALNPGAKMTVQVPVKIDGGGHIPVSFNASVDVVNFRLDRRPIAELLYSNDPESVTRFQTLFSGELSPDEPKRLLYHHQNMMGKRFRFNLEILNPSNTTARVHVVRAISDPLVDTVLVGYIAGSKFLRDYVNNVGFVVDIPAGSKYIVYSDNVDPVQTASGILEFRELSGAPLRLRVGADVPQMSGYRTGSVEALRSGEMDGPLSDEVFPSPTKQLTASYNVGDRWAFIPVGKHAIKDDSTGKLLYGNYGVLYEIRVQISNPTGVAKKVSVLFEPGAGLAGGVFFVDGRFVETKYIAPPKEFRIADYQLQPNQSKIVSILTVPLAGSAYPANILVKS